VERIRYLLLEIGAVVVGIVLFVLGYTTVKNKFYGQKALIFWTAVAVVLTFLSLTFNRTEGQSKKESLSASDTEKKETLEDQPEWKRFVAIWESLTPLENEMKTLVELRKIKEDNATVLSELEKLTNKGLLTPVLLNLLAKELSLLIDVYPRIPLGKCYIGCYHTKHSSDPAVSWMRLQDRLPLLEKIVEEDKINYWTYKNVILRLKKDVEFLDEKVIAKGDWKQNWQRIKEQKKITDEQIETVKNKVKKSLGTLVDKLTVEKLSADDEKRVKDWINDLGNEDFQKRQSATKSLKALLDKTPAVIPYLREAAKSSDPEVKMRIRQILESVGESVETEQKPDTKKEEGKDEKKK